MVARCRAFGLLLEDDVNEPPCLLKLLVGPRVRHVGDVTKVAGGGYHVVHLTGKHIMSGAPMWLLCHIGERSEMARGG